MLLIVQRRYLDLSWFLLFYALVLNFCVVCTLCAFLNTEWPHIGKIDTDSANDMLSLYKFLFVNLFFPPLVLKRNVFLIVLFPGHCLL